MVFAEWLWEQTLYRLGALEVGVIGEEIDLLAPFEPTVTVIHEFQPERAASLRNWLAPPSGVS